MRRTIFSLCALLIAAMAHAQTPTPSQPAAEAGAVTLVELETLALAGNPTLRAAQARVDAARAAARQAATWPNPVIGYAGEEIALNPQAPRGAHGFFIEQTIPLGGKLRVSRAVFDREAERAEIELDLQRRRILSSVRLAFAEALIVERRIEMHERLAALVSEAIAITAQLFNVGAADRPDFLESQIESKRVDLQLNAAKNRAFALRQQLAAVVGRADVAARPLSGSLADALPEIEREAARRALLHESPHIRVARAELARTQAITAQARRAARPDLFVRGGALYNREIGDHSIDPIGWEATLEAGVTVPLFNRNTAGIASARAGEARAQAELERRQLSLQSQLAVEFASYLTALGASESYRREILPLAEEAFRLYLARYREMAAAYPQVLIAQRNLLELSTEYLQALEDAWRSALRIQNLLVGDGLQSPAADDINDSDTGRPAEREEKR